MKIKKFYLTKMKKVLKTLSSKQFEEIQEWQLE